MAITLNGTTGITTPALDTSGDVTFADNDKAVFGAGSDLQIYHIADTGNLIQGQSTYGNIDIMSHSTRILDNGSNVMADFSTSGSSSRLFNGADGLKLATTATGIDVTGTVAASNGTAALPAFTFVGDTNNGMFKAGNDEIGFSTSSAEAMRIDGWGNLLVGTTSSTGNEAIAQFKRTINGASGYFEVLNSIAGVQNAVDIVSATNAAFTPIRFWVNGYGTTLVGSITATTSSVSYNTSSDYRLKTDAQPMVGASDRVLALKPVNFAWISDGSRVDGFLAHEAQEVVPEAVHGTKDGMEDYEITPAVLDDDGNVTTEAVMGTRPVMQGIDQSKLVPLLTAALQEALNKIEAMETRLAALEAV
jgi:hypothetical protein